MYKHDIEDIVNDEHEVEEIVVDKNEVENDTSDEKDEDDEEEDDENAVDDDENESESDNDDEHQDVKIGNLTFENPSQSDKSDDEATEKKSLKCESCVFLAPTMQRLEKHECEVHSVPGKYVCVKCKRVYDTRKEFNNHKYFGCF